MRAKISGTALFLFSAYTLFAQTAVESEQTIGMGPEHGPKPPSKPFCHTINDFRDPKNLHGGSFFAEYLLWKVSQQASYFAISQTTPFPSYEVASGNTATCGLGTYEIAELDLASGFRVGWSYTAPYDRWNVLGQYTYYSTDGSVTYDKPASNLYLWGTFTVVTLDFVNGITSANSHSDFNYNILDVLLSRNVLMSPQILLNFSLGATGAWIDEDWKVTYGSNVNTCYIKNNWSFNGGGLKTGLESNWHFGKGFGLLGKAAFALLLGRYDYSNKAESIPNRDTTTSLSASLYRDVTLEQTILAPTAQLALGFDWGRIYERFAIHLAVLGEINSWFDLQQIYSVPKGNSNFFDDKMTARDAASVNLYGLTARANVDF